VWDVDFIELLFEMKFLEQLEVRAYFPDPHLDSVFFLNCSSCCLIELMCLLNGNIYNRQGWYHRCMDASLDEDITVSRSPIFTSI